MSSKEDQITEFTEQDLRKQDDIKPVTNSENQQIEIADETAEYPSSFFSYIASFYSETDSSDSFGSCSEVPPNKRCRIKRSSKKTKGNTEDRRLTNGSENQLPTNGIPGERSLGNNPVRKRKSNSACSIRNIRKIARIQGKPYISTTGVIQPGKKLKNPCACRKKCFEKLSEKERENIFIEFYKLSDEAQNQQIASSIEEYPKKTVRLRNRNALDTKVKSVVDAGDRRVATTGDNNVSTEEGNLASTSRRSFSRKYFLSKPNKQRLEVCQIMYLNTLAITLMKTRVVLLKKRISGSDISYKDGRGKHGKQKEVAEKAKQKNLNTNKSRIDEQ